MDMLAHLVAGGSSRSKRMSIEQHQFHSIFEFYVHSYEFPINR